MSGEALGTAALAQSAAAMAMAQQARKEACKATISAFDSKAATIEQAKGYAECVNLVYPSDLSATDIIGLKAIFVVALIGMALGGWYGWRESYGDAWVMVFIGGLLGFFLVPLALGAVILLGAGVIWLFK